MVIGNNFIMNSYTCMTQKKAYTTVSTKRTTTSSELPIIEHKNTTTYTVENPGNCLGKTQKVARLNRLRRVWRYRRGNQNP